MKGVERWGDIGRSRLWRKEASTRFDHSTDEEASARLGTHHLDSLLRANPLP